MTARPIPLLASATITLVGLSLLLAGCVSGGAVGSSAPEITQRVEGEAAEQIVGPDLMAEYTAFTDAQQLPDDPTAPLTAVTPAQKSFVAEEKMIAADAGRPWTADDETVALSLGFEGCQIAILNAHAVDADLLRNHVGQSDIYRYLIDPTMSEEERVLVEADVTRTLARGATHLCPEDGARWTAAAESVYGS